MHSLVFQLFIKWSTYYSLLPPPLCHTNGEPCLADPWIPALTTSSSSSFSISLDDSFLFSLGWKNVLIRGPNSLWEWMTLNRSGFNHPSYFSVVDKQGWFCRIVRTPHAGCHTGCLRNVCDGLLLFLIFWFLLLLLLAFPIISKTSNEAHVVNMVALSTFSLKQPCEVSQPEGECLVQNPQGVWRLEPRSPNLGSIHCCGHRCGK